MIREEVFFVKGKKQKSLSVIRLLTLDKEKLKNTNNERNYNLKNRL